MRQLLLILAAVLSVHGNHFEPTWDSLDSRSNPAWYVFTAVGVRETNPFPCGVCACVERSAFLCFWWLCDWTDGNRYDAARFGIKIHWGPYAVPAYGALGQYAEQYARWYRVGTEGCGTDANPISSGCDTALFHRSTFGSMSYEQFYSRFNPVLFDAAQWADIFRRGGAWHLSDLCGQLVHGCTNN